MEIFLGMLKFRVGQFKVYYSITLLNRKLNQLLGSVLECIMVYNKNVIVDLCFSRHEMLLNSKLNYIDRRLASVNMKFTFNNTPCPPHNQLIIIYCFIVWNF